jgi:hypothetical protein
LVDSTSCGREIWTAKESSFSSKSRVSYDNSFTSETSHTRKDVPWIQGMMEL